MKMPESTIAGLIATDFDDQKSERPMRYIHASNDHALANWILWQHPDGQWVTLREATEDDLAGIDELQANRAATRQ
jgi:hypothetical protein